MRKLSIFIIMLCLLFYAGTAFAEAVGVWNAFGSGDNDLSLPGKQGKRVCVSNLYLIDAGTATSDIAFYGSSGDKTYLTGDEAIGQTVLASSTTAAVNGIGTTAHVILQRASGIVAEYGLLASYAALAPTLTAATTVAFYKGDQLWEMDIILSPFNDIPTTATSIENERGLFCGPPNSPLLMLSTADAWVEGMFGFYVDNDFSGPIGAPVGSFLGDAAGGDLAGLALPGVAGKRIVVTGFGSDLVGADDDINWYTWTGLATDESTFSADEAIAQTTLSARADPGFADTLAGPFFYERADGTYADIKVVSSYTSGGVITSSATEKAFKEDDHIRLAEILRVADDSIESIIAISNPYGLFTVPTGKPVGILSEETDGVLNYLIGFYEDANAPRRTVANYTSDDTATGTGGALIALPGFEGKRTCVNSITFTPTTGGTDDMFFYTAAGPVNSAWLSEASAAADTSLVWISEQGADNIADTAYIVLQSADGDKADLVLLSDATITTGTATAGHVNQAYPKGSRVIEMENLATGYILLNGVGAGQTISNAQGLFCGPVGSPVGARLAGANSQIEQMSGYAE